jgi:oxygen-independent coproporphyrinogen III oxidase
MDLIRKYNSGVPRYTSYPTVPYWTGHLDAEEWGEQVRSTFSQTNPSEGISLYIHLPYCESLCTYCACNTRITVNHKVEEPYVLAVLEEWALYLELFEDTPRIRELHLGGGTPTFFSAKNLRRLIEGICSTAIVCKDAQFSFEGHPGNTSEEHLKTLHELGFTRVSFGIQDFNARVQKAINRHQTFEQVRSVVETARRLGYTSVNFDLVYGLPLQTQATVRDTVEKVLQLRPERIAFYSYAHVPWLKPGQRGYSEKDLPLDIEKRNLYELGCAAFREQGYQEIGMDHFALPTDELAQAARQEKLHRNFMGYTTCSTKLLVGLGNSAISDTWFAFAQNHKKVEDYIAAVQKGEFAIHKGHLLTSEDMIIRQHILNLMCGFRTSWADPALQFADLNEVTARLEELQADGLVVLEPFRVRITDVGRPFIRNVCMAFDLRYWRLQPAPDTFSRSL